MKLSNVKLLKIIKDFLEQKVMICPGHRGPGRVFLARALDPRPETSPGRPEPEKSGPVRVLF
jgi:hypothetical protein